MNPGIGPFKLKGCYTDLDQNNRAVSQGDGGGSKKDASLSAQKCIEMAGKHKYAALEWHEECYWGDILNSGAKKVSDSDCDTPCNGNDKEICGGGNRITLYENSNFQPPAPPGPPPVTRAEILIGIQACVDCIKETADNVNSWINAIRNNKRKRNGKDAEIQLQRLQGTSSSCRKWGSIHDLKAS